MEFLAKVRELYEHLPVILLTGYASLDSAKEAVKLNATDYLLKPLESIDDLLNPIHKAVYSYKLLLENKRLMDSLRIKIKELKEEVEFNFALLQYNPVETIVVDREGKVVKTNLAKGRSGNRIPNIGDVMYKDYAGKHEIDMYAELMECIRSGRSKEFPEQKYGDNVLSITISPFPKGAIIMSKDITEHKRAEEKLRESEKKYRALFERLKNEENKLRKLRRKLIRVREEELHSLSREIHDECGQYLSALKIKLGLLLHEISPSDKRLKSEIISTEKTVKQLINIIHNLSLRLSPPELERLGLIESISWLIYEHEKLTNQQCNFQKPDTEIGLLTEYLTTLYRIVQEGLTNIKKHANAKKVDVILQTHEGKIRLVVKDDGTGFDYNHFLQKHQPRHELGLVGLQERVAILDGKMDVITAPGKGTTIQVEIPIPDERKQNVKP